MANLKSEVASKGAELFETTRFGPTGQVGTLKPGAEPAVILLPEFLAAVRQAWNTSDSLAVLLATPHARSGGVRCTDVRSIPETEDWLHCR